MTYRLFPSLFGLLAMLFSSLMSATVFTFHRLRRHIERLQRFGMRQVGTALALMLSHGKNVLMLFSSLFDAGLLGRHSRFLSIGVRSPAWLRRLSQSRGLSMKGQAHTRTPSLAFN